ncbi:MAG: proline dehydrogenase [Ignavibacteriae bacterium]|nr:proline dehydrogenase [Ignavibacteriota bacterium]NOG99672.1 proline dehydrogenase [Ignavibacteriota bacterium]
MGLSRTALLWCSQNKWMKTNVPKYAFVKKAVKKFMPGETVEDAVAAALEFNNKNIGTLFTQLGENISNLDEADSVTQHYLDVLKIISSQNLTAEISIKLTQLGFDFSFDQTFKNISLIAAKAKELNNFVWIDMEQSYYVDDTIKVYKKLKSEFDNIGLCLQSYLMRTKSDLEEMINISPAIRLVKGAYMEPANVAFKKKFDVDENYFELTKYMLTAGLENNARIAIATHDLKMISRIKEYAKSNNISNDRFEFNMLYGIKTDEQKKLVEQGKRLSVLISYGENWYPWYVRRLAERPANIGFVIRNMF